MAIVGKIGLKNLDSTLATTIRAIIMAGFLMLVSFALKKFKGFTWQTLSSHDWLFIVAAGIFGALSWLFYFLALKNGPINPVVAIDRLSLVFVIIMSLLFLSETITIKVALGALLMVGGALLISLK